LSKSETTKKKKPAGENFTPERGRKIARTGAAKRKENLPIIKKKEFSP